MMTVAAPVQPVGFSQLADFLSGLERKNGNEPFLKRGTTPELLMLHLEEELPVAPAPIIFRRLGKHTQLCLHFS